MLPVAGCQLPGVRLTDCVYRLPVASCRLPGGEIDGIAFVRFVPRGCYLSCRLPVAGCRGVRLTGLRLQVCSEGLLFMLPVIGCRLPVASCRGDHAWQALTVFRWLNVHQFAIVVVVISGNVGNSFRVIHIPAFFLFLILFFFLIFCE